MSGRMQQVPQLAVVLIDSQQVAERVAKVACRISAASMSLLFSKDKSGFRASLLHLFAKDGGEVDYGDIKLRYIPPLMSYDRPKIRLWIAYPHDFSKTSTSEDVEKAAIAGLIMQSILAKSLSDYAQKSNLCSDMNRCMFAFDESWDAKSIKVPQTSRTYLGTEDVSISGPIKANSVFPSVGVINLDKCAVEVNTDRHVTNYISRCLELLGERRIGTLYHLAFLPPDTMDRYDYINEKFETRNNVIVIKSPVFRFLPRSVCCIHNVLKCTTSKDPENCQTCLRTVPHKETCFSLQHTLGGLVASLLGAVIHEIGHLFKLPHMDCGIMQKGSDNIQLYILPDRNINLGVSRTDCIRYNHDSEESITCYVVRKDVILDKLVDNTFDILSLEIMYNSPLINWSQGKVLSPISFDQHSLVVKSEAGIRFILYYTDNEKASVIHRIEYEQNNCFCFTLQEGKNRALIVARDGNTMICVCAKDYSC